MMSNKKILELEKKVEDLEGFNKTLQEYLDNFVGELNSIFEIIVSDNHKSYINVERIKNSIHEFKSYKNFKNQLLINFSKKTLEGGNKNEK